MCRPKVIIWNEYPYQFPIDSTVVELLDWNAVTVRNITESVLQTNSVNNGKTFDCYIATNSTPSTSYFVSIRKNVDSGEELLKKINSPASILYSMAIFGCFIVTSLSLMIFIPLIALKIKSCMKKEKHGFQKEVVFVNGQYLSKDGSELEGYYV